MRLSRNFDTREFAGWDQATEAQKGSLAWLVTNVLQPTRDKWGELRVTAWVSDSPSRLQAHPTGGAVDFVPVFAQVAPVHQWMAKSLAGRYGELIDERDHIHATIPGVGGDGEVLVEPEEGVFVRIDPAVGFPDGSGSWSNPITIPGVTATVGGGPRSSGLIWGVGLAALLLFMGSRR